MYLTAKLQSDEEWETLAATMDPDNGQQDSTVKQLLEYVRSIGAESCVIEEYLDQDFTAAYSAYYSKLFKRYRKLCRRFHFFDFDITDLIIENSPEDVCLKLEKAVDKYLGFVVVRPTPHAPIMRAVLKPPGSTNDISSHLLVRADYKVHLLGATLSVCGAPFTQQDSRVGACAQASIWSAARHIHVRHRGPWVSTVDITAAATKIVDYASTQIPVGAGFLTFDNMLRALSAIERQPLAYYKSEEAGWGDLSPADMINRYIDSGIPVILGLKPWDAGNIGHAVLAVGHGQKRLPDGFCPNKHPNKAMFCDHFLVMDDQLGAYKRMSIEKRLSACGQTPYNIDEHLAYIIAPLPDKVFINAEDAEIAAWSYFSTYCKIINNMKLIHSNLIQDSINKAKEIIDLHSNNNIVARTYLTYGWKYKSRILRNTIGNRIKNAIVDLDFPKFVWVTEFGTLKGLNHLEVKKRTIVGHSVIDATSSRKQDHLKVFHAPGLFVQWLHDPEAPTGKDRAEHILIDEESEYSPKVRGILAPSK